MKSRICSVASVVLVLYCCRPANTGPRGMGIQHLQQLYDDLFTLCEYGWELSRSRWKGILKRRDRILLRTKSGIQRTTAPPLQNGRIDLLAPAPVIRGLTAGHDNDELFACFRRIEREELTGPKVGKAPNSTNFDTDFHSCFQLATRDVWHGSLLSGRGGYRQEGMSSRAYYQNTSF